MAVILVFALAETARAAQSHAVANPLSSQNGADYLVIAPPAFEAALAPLLDKRAADGLRTALVTTVSIHDAFPYSATGAHAIRDFVRYAYFQWQALRPRYLLLIGDTVATAPYAPGDPSLPTFLVNTSIAESPTASDNHYADMDSDGLPDLAVGRLPADSPQELSTMIQKILVYETAAPSGPWRRRVNMFASEGHFGAVDDMLEDMFKKLVRNNVSPNFDLTMTYANPAMPYFFIPDRFGEKVIERFNEGSLFMVYIGHGHHSRFDTVRWNGNKYPIMDSGKVPGIDSQGRSPIVFIIACLTGDFDMPEDSIGEELLKSKTGPVGVFASSEISHPYSNSILAKDIAFFFLHEKPETVGEGLVRVKRALIKRFDEDRRSIDRLTGLMLPKKELDAQNRDHLYLYNYFGDPAMRIAYPGGALAVQAPEKARPGTRISVTVPQAPQGSLRVTLECPATEIIHTIADIENLEGAHLEKAIAANYANANDKIAAVADQHQTGAGDATAALDIPENLPPGQYFIKAYAWGAHTDSMGFAPIAIE
jgi:hypothetical protein